MPMNSFPRSGHQEGSSRLAAKASGGAADRAVTDPSRLPLMMLEVLRLLAGAERPVPWELPLVTETACGKGQCNADFRTRCMKHGLDKSGRKVVVRRMYESSIGPPEITSFLFDQFHHRIEQCIVSNTYEL